MSLFDLPRVPEAEVMDDSAEVEAYSCAAAHISLEKIDDTFIEHAVRLLQVRRSGETLDIGTGPGQIVIKLARRLPGWTFIGVDRAPRMIDQADANLKAAGALGGCIQFQVDDGNRLAFADSSFDFVMCNSVLHHLAEPQKLLAEVARLVKPGGAILVRDLRRPLRFLYPFHARWHGRQYSGVMRKLYCDSVRAAYTPSELRKMLIASPIRNARVFLHGVTHIGIERAISREVPCTPAGEHL
jgi:ubiquinone/menaquinone biosynthesis C-methylase UbiE